MVAITFFMQFDQMTKFLLEDLQERQMIHQISDQPELSEHLATGMRTLYCGFDPTADSLHIGNLLPLLTLRRFQLQGHRPIALVGGATGLIGDPSGKSKERTLNSDELTEEWTQKIKSQVSQYLDFDAGAQAALVANNLEWTRSLPLLDFLRDTGKHFSVNAMIQKESVRSRIERDEVGISFTEFSYMLLQSLDYVELARRYDCTLQIGGSDQWGNITAGMDLVRKALDRKAHALTLSLITRENGEKFGKTAGGETLWLDSDKTSSYQFYQFWINTADEQLQKMLGYFTLLDYETRQGILEDHARAPEKRYGQHRLAQEVTLLVHGAAKLESAERITKVLFEGETQNLHQEDMPQLAQGGLPCVKIDSADMYLRSALVAMGLIKNTHAFKSAVLSKAVQVNGQVVESFGATFAHLQPLFGLYFLIRFGKRKWGLAYLGS